MAAEKNGSARKRRFQPKANKISLMLLPLELRRAVYDCVYDKEICIELLPSPLNSRFLKPLPRAPVLDLTKTRSSTKVMLARYPKPKGYTFDPDYTVTKLHLVNKQISAECIGYLYRRLRLFTQSCTPIHSFCKAVPASNLRHIRALDLIHTTYAHPVLLEHEIWKQKADAAWEHTLAAVATHLPDLRRLRVTLEVRDIPFQLSATAPWATALLALSALPKLESVSVNVGSMVLRNQRAFLHNYTRTPLTLAGMNYVAGLELEHASTLLDHENVGFEIARAILCNGKGAARDFEREHGVDGTVAVVLRGSR